MSLSRTVTILFFAALIQGCALSGKEFTYNPEHSEALNVMNAAGMSASLADRSMPKDTVNGDIRDSSAFSVAHVTASYNAPLPGFTGLEMAGLGITQVFFAPTPATAKNSMFAWMPESVAKNDPVQTLIGLLKNAALLVAAEMGYESFTRDIDIQMPFFIPDMGEGFYVSMHQENESGCHSEKNVCLFIMRVNNQTSLAKPPAFLAQNEQSYFFDPNTSYPTYSFTKGYTGINELEFITRLTSHMPSWFYMYVAPKKIKITSDDLVMVPLIVNQGKALHFITPETLLKIGSN